ncbi:MAG: SGNH/GDSL hydrolase family protein [Thermoflexibacter sp.]|jgi:lysophospholipase L1-like esterase|nr:SGNH/GDSL hydrolase family protein [Thermoflexibacter sp.]
MEQGKGSKSLTYLALGDSYTIGESVKEQERYPVILVNQLQKANIDIALPKIIARTGWTTDELLSAISKENLADTYHLVSLLIGVNNQYRGYSLEIYQKEFEELLKIAIKKAGGNKDRVFVVSIPDYGVTPFAQGRDREKIGKEIDTFNQANRKITDQYGVKYFDITAISRKAQYEESLTAEDGLHPAGKMYEEWVSSMIEDVKILLEK